MRKPARATVHGDDVSLCLGLNDESFTLASLWYVFAQSLKSRIGHNIGWQSTKPAPDQPWAPRRAHPTQRVPGGVGAEECARNAREMRANWSRLLSK